MNTKRTFIFLVGFMVITSLLLTTIVLPASAAAPDNDYFANATVITDIPYSDSPNVVEAGSEMDEPWSCGWYLTQTVWYSFTPVESGSYTASASGMVFPVLAVYQGSDLYNLQSLSCVDGYELGSYTQTTLWLDAGTTYYFQIYLLNIYSWLGGTMDFQLIITPPPVPQFGYSPWDPSRFDSIQFYNDSYDPMGTGIESCAWDFGDGSTSTDCYPIHQFYTGDGDYTVQLDVTTNDGRTGSTSQTVQIRTHDVGITRFIVPTSGRVGQTKQVNVYIKNLEGPETVQVDLYKSTGGDYEWVGSLTQYVPVRPANRAQLFTFAYTFSEADAAQGRVIFSAVATIANQRDAYPADNGMISSPAKVTR